MTNLKPSTRRVLNVLKASGERGCTTAELCQPEVGGIRFSARIQELRDAGYSISGSPVRPGRWRYRLVRDPLDERQAA